MKTNSYGFISLKKILSSYGMLPVHNHKYSLETHMGKMLLDNATKTEHCTDRSSSNLSSTSPPAAAIESASSLDLPPKRAAHTTSRRVDPDPRRGQNARSNPGDERRGGFAFGVLSTDYPAFMFPFLTRELVPVLRIRIRLF